jgi:hypothetical protein
MRAVTLGGRAQGVRGSTACLGEGAEGGSCIGQYEFIVTGKA